jgi:hypothetical protein
MTTMTATTGMTTALTTATTARTTASARSTCATSATGLVRDTCPRYALSLPTYLDAAAFSVDTNVFIDETKGVINVPAPICILFAP